MIHYYDKQLKIKNINLKELALISRLDVEINT